MSALAAVQARMTSARLPGKSLADVCGQPMLQLLLGRLSRARSLERIIIATSDDEAGDPIAELAEELGYAVHRGSRDDVLGRIVGALDGWEGPAVRITADCPLIDAEVVDAVVDLFEKTSGCRYASNLEPRIHPDGLDVEVLDATALREVAAETSDPHDREHVAPAVLRDPGRFPRAALHGDTALADLRWTVDLQEDLDFVRLVVERLGDRREEAGWQEVLAAVRADPSLADFYGRRG